MSGQEQLFLKATEVATSNLTPEEKMSLPSDYAAFGKIQKESTEGMDSRQQLYKALMNRGSEIDQKQAQLLEQINTDKPMSNSQIAAMLLIGLTPMLAGGAIKGDRGLAAGAAAGAIGTQTMAKGFEAENERARNRGIAQYDLLSKEKLDLNKQAFDVQRDEFNSADKFALQDSQNATRLQAAAISGGAMASGLAGLKKGFDTLASAYKANELGREDASTTQPVVMEGVAYRPSKAVDKTSADAVTLAAEKYSQATQHIQDILDMSANMDIATIQRSLGDKSSDMYQKYTLAQNAVMDVKKIPGLKGTDAVTNLDKFLSSPTSLVANLWRRLPGTATFEGEYNAAKTNLQKDFDNLLKQNKYEKYAVGDVVTVNGQQVKITTLLPDGSFDGEIVK